jgi:hypothetical protein
MSRYYAGGGAGFLTNTYSSGGLGGGGSVPYGIPTQSPRSGDNGVTNTGGGGAASRGANGGSGGSGIVIIRYAA